MATQIKMENLCRTCLSKNSLLHNLFDEQLENASLEQIITAVTGLKIEKDDILPKTICQECKVKAHLAFVFKITSEEAEVKLRKLAENHTPPAEVKIEIDPEYDYDMGADCDNLPSADYPETQNTLQCKVCSEVFESEREFKDHVKNLCLKVEMEQSRVHCPMCAASCSSSASLTRHMFRAHSGLAPPNKKCKSKNVHLRTINILDKLSDNGFNIKKLSNLKHEYLCTFCNTSFHQKKKLIDHYYNDHTDTKVYCCVVCNKNFLILSSFDEHTCERLATRNDSIKSTSESETFINEKTLHSILDPEYYSENIDDPQVCSFCNEILLTKNTMMSHIDTFHPEESQRCNFCLKVFATVKSAKRHKLSCKHIERKFKCGVCGLRYAYEISLNKHILRYHQGASVSTRFIDRRLGEDKPFQCAACPRKFYRAEQLEKHSHTHTAKEKIYECDNCHKKFNRKDNLKSHMRVHMPRSGLPPKMKSLCTFCGRGFTHSSNMIVHLRRHTGEKPYKCDFCGKGFPRSSDLACHRRTHTGEKICHCAVCGKSFSRSSRLTRHMRVHTGARPFKCTYCDKAFSQSNDLNVHVRRHTGDKPYICEVCGDRFIQGTALQNHRRAHGHFPPAPPPPPAEPLPRDVRAYAPSALL